ncbi:Permease of the drug/metabolite transporter (DMT) superfamily [Collimonas arenae]|uniref:Permease of the drug/metabolite transporter (DMT) superfamily n=1 Tax=Collimonas arenae TaxID=279058 RepID=A0A0A1FE37_9BURK|nr:DMT family transporter [Collimonas arenae]AIY41914.1 Permease of the drug/metabolite transporter (DMT) superfamily [Collimonas arenae]
MNLAELFSLAAIWGASFLFMRIGAPEFGPVPLIALRVGIAALVLFPVLRSAVARNHLRSKLWPMLVVGVTNSALPFSLFAYSTLYVNAGFDAVLNATVPLWTGLIAFVWLKSPMSRPQVIGMLVGMVGVVVLVWDKIGEGQPGVWLATAAVLLATLSYGFAINYSKTRLAGVPPFVVACGSQLAATLVLLPLALIYWPAAAVSSTAWYSVLALGVLCTGVAYVIFYRLLDRVGSAYAASVTFLIPIFGVIWGAIFLKEQVTLGMVFGCLIILLGTALATGKLNLSNYLRAKSNE